MCPSASTNVTRAYLLQTFILTVLAGGLGGWMYFSAFPGHYFSGYPALPAFFFLLGTIQVSIVEKCRKAMPQKLALMYLLVRMGRTVLSLVFLLACCIVLREEALRFTLTFAAFYVIYLAYDTWFFGVKGNKINEKK